MYPLDQLRAFQSLRDGEMSEEESAARHLVTPAIVKQRLRLASGFTKMDGVYTGADCVSTPWQARELALRLAREAEAVCRIYLSNGRRTGRYWLVGDVKNTPGRSLFVRLEGGESGRGAAGKWTDAATGEHGDLLDIIRETCGLVDFHDVATEARRFLSLPRLEPDLASRSRLAPAPAGSAESARRLFALSHPVPGTLVETYLRTRGITALPQTNSLRFHPRCYYRPDQYSPTETWPAMIAAVTDLRGAITGVHRTYLAPSRLGFSGNGKAPIDTPRRAMGHLLGNAVRFGAVDDVALPAKVSRRCCRCFAPCQKCRCLRRSQRHISPPSCFPGRCVGSISSATTIRRAMARWRSWSTGPARPGSRRLHCRRAATISTTM